MTTPLTLAPHFPRSKGCEKQAETFFNCFSTATETALNSSRNPTGTDSDNIASGKVDSSGVLQGCKSELGSYDRCMVNAIKKFPEKYSRAGAAYRGRA